MAVTWRQLQTKLPWSQTDSVTCSLALSDNWAYKALSFSTWRYPRTAATPRPACGLRITAGGQGHSPKEQPPLQINMAMHGATSMCQHQTPQPTAQQHHHNGFGWAAHDGKIKCRLENLNSPSPLPYPFCLWPRQPRFARLQTTCLSCFTSQVIWFK